METNKYKCPYVVRKKGFEFLMCRICMKADIDYNIRENAITAFCAYQYRCLISGKMENTDEARECFEYHSKKEIDRGEEAQK